ncbi:protein UL148A [Panine betaherpesvirus 2]|uniref:Protein UL148A n=1 Tax=Panine betaherpesvirus 2 TaxID=188763 RepID=Q8QRW5_9BETA|nr:protein UL148A [Panine betaherpesvirus 2]AAM00773.1 protein UL148A [Panine betaherpesvirus 2]QXV67887.1 protein UL148A [Panine betaherpesvirus 2]
MSDDYSDIMEHWIPISIVVVLTSLIITIVVNAYLWYFRRDLAAFCRESVCGCCLRGETEPLTRAMEPPAEVEMRTLSSSVEELTTLDVGTLGVLELQV